MHATDRLHEEIAFHDRQAHDRAAAFRDDGELCFTDDDYLDHETWIRPALDRLGDVRGLRVLDYGCGHSMAGVVLARRGGNVSALDISGGYLEEASRRALANGVDVTFIQTDGERPPFPDASFDRIWGNAILHHLDLSRAAPQLYRILKPGGVAVFCEPWGENPVLDWARHRLPYPGKHRTRDERPLREGDLLALRAAFTRVEVEGYQLLSMARRLLGTSPVSRSLEWCDRRLLKRVPFLRRYCRYVVLTLRRGV